MNKSELVEALAAHYEGSRSDAARALSAFVQTVSSATAAGERVAITGFGVFERVERPARTVRNPRTGERLDVPATAVPRFRAGTELKAYVSGSRPVPRVPAAPATPLTSAPAPAPAPVVAAPTQQVPETKDDPSTKKATSKAAKPKATAAKSKPKAANSKADKPKAKADKPKGKSDKKSKGKKK